MAFLETWDEEKPAGTRDRSLGDDDIREFKRAIRERLAIDHAFYEDETGQSVGYHLKATLKDVVADDPSLVAGYGIIYVKTVSGKIEIMYRNPDGIKQLTANGYLLGDNIRLSNNVYLLAKDAAGTGTVNLIKASAADKPVLPDGAELATSAAPTTDVQIANKKYVDDEIAGISIPAQVGFGARVAKSANVNYQAATDGLVSAYLHHYCGGTLIIYSDANASPSTAIASQSTGSGTTEFGSTLTISVKKGDYYRIYQSGGDSFFAYWMPLGS